MTAKRRNVLVVGMNASEFERVAPFLDRATFDVDRFPSVQGALELVDLVTFEVLIVRYPPPDMELYTFLERVRQERSPCRTSPLLLVSTNGSLEEARGYIGRGANRVIRLEDTADVIQSAISGLLDVAPRTGARFLARLEVKLGGAKDMILCQTENVSVSGMLLKTDRRYDAGIQFHFELSLPGDQRPISGLAEVVRHTMIGRDKVGGIGVRFLSFFGDSQRRFEAFLESR